MCATCGQSYGELIAHIWGETYEKDASQHWKKCTVCQTSGTKENHSGGTATCTAQAVCTVCKQSYGELIAHSFTGNCLSDADGHWHKCQNCDATDTKANHTAVTDAAVPATCGAAGKTEGSHCSVCGYVITAQTDVPATGNHTYSGYEKNDTQHWQKCTVCQTEDTKAAHTPGDWIIDTEATTQAAGSKHKECTVCHCTTETATIPKEETPDQPDPPGTSDDPVDLPGGGTVTKDPDTGEVTIAPPEDDPGGMTVTITPGNNGDVTVNPDTGEVTVPVGSTVKKSDETATTITAGTGVVKPDGTVTFPHGGMAETTAPDGTTSKIVAKEGSIAGEVVIRPDTPHVTADHTALQEVAGEEPAESITVTLIVEKKAESAADNASEIKQVASGKTVEFLDLSLIKTVTSSSGGSTGTPITDTNGKVLEIEVTYDTSRQGVTVYRYHGSSAEKLTKAEGDAKAGGTFKLGTASVIIYATKFSTYAIGYTPESSSSGGGGGGWSGPTTYPVETPGADGGKITVSPKNAASGTTVTLTLTPDQGYTISGVTVTDRNGKQIAVTDKGDGKYTFTMPSGKVTVTGAFTRIMGSYKDCPRDSTCPIARFPDASPTAWYHDGVHYCLEHGLMEGYDTGLFGPGDRLSRAHLVQMLYNQAGRPDVTEESSFEDVAPGAWYAKAVAWARQSGIVNGYDSRRFHPDGRITREQLAAILWRYAGSPAAAGLALDFTDAGNVSGYAADALRWAVDRKIIYGKGSGILDPAGLATRAEAASMLMRYGTIRIL